MKEVDLKTIEEVGTTKLTRAEKLLRWADLVRQQNYRMQIFHLLENWDQYMLDHHIRDLAIGPNAFAVAFGDPAFQAAGLKADGTGTVQDVMNFFELSQAELHEFSCNCGGEISNRDMADRIAGLASGGRATSSFRDAVNRIMGH